MQLATRLHWVWQLVIALRLLLALAFAGLQGLAAADEHQGLSLLRWYAAFTTHANGAPNKSAG
jgi:hypothetical protein